MTDHEPVTVLNLLRRIETGRSEFDRLLESSQDPTANGWSPKDHKAHIACWERSALALLNGEPRFGHLGMSVEDYRELDTDAVNERAYAAYRDAPASEVEALYTAAHDDLVAKLRSMSDEDLMRPYSHYQPNDPPWNPNPVWPWIAGNTYEHYEEHAEYMAGAGD